MLHFCLEIFLYVEVFWYISCVDQIFTIFHKWISLPLNLYAKGSKSKSHMVHRSSRFLWLLRWERSHVDPLAFSCWEFSKVSLFICGYVKCADIYRDFFFKKRSYKHIYSHILPYTLCQWVLSEFFGKRVRHWIFLNFIVFKLSLLWILPFYLDALKFSLSSPYGWYVANRHISIYIILMLREQNEKNSRQICLPTTPRGGALWHFRNFSAHSFIERHKESLRSHTNT